jgi:hypothetical protein
MMHGREKSDTAIVAGKPTNKAVPTAAEPVKPRAGAKGNANPPQKPCAVILHARSTPVIRRSTGFRPAFEATSERNPRCEAGCAAVRSFFD